METVTVTRTLLGGTLNCPHCGNSMRIANGTIVPDNGLIHDCPHCGQPLCLVCGGSVNDDGNGGHSCPKCQI